MRWRLTTPRAVLQDGSTSTTSTVVGWNWSFGDGGTSTLQNPTHAYLVPGPYNITLIATDANGVIQIFNVGAERMLGYDAAEVMNKITPAFWAGCRGNPSAARCV